MDCPEFERWNYCMIDQTDPDKGVAQNFPGEQVVR